ncbi:WHG domain-containing protein [Microbacterium sp. cx-55]|uniref:TetR-like C-terminal domain-containing protein n=1 Tax=Microbacterium sp. cx-55 TaxID=2875948 RepID=UPI001CC1C04E|nr:TetR-like C-terminal domain-containing protein [Microbacterium sp. cx-55]MBZ4486559.1 WHG domain-containing protein [Microbacterium sp. cx-55]UGB36473.1 WHG domain-containing protein [Microbacterium sp. cx-55]
MIDRAAELLDAPGAEGLNLAAVAASLGVKTPSLYKHIDGMPGVLRGVTLRAKAELGTVMGQAAIGRSRDEAITGMSMAYRTWALAHPGQYALTVRAPAADDAEDTAASAAVIDVIYAVLAGYELRDEDAVHATRFFRAALHGFVSLETSGAFALAVDRERSFERLVQSVVTALSTWARE